MNLDQLRKANDVKSKLDDFKKALECFEYVPNEEESKERKPISLNPNLIIEFDDWDDGREQIKLPMVLSDYLISLIKTTINEQIIVLSKEFEAI
ncbi:hypothetical protein CLU81_3582 [Flavobacterium sp. 9]|uniref:hypothetical protein n=1 Tax=Flavobacterium sp. 9 TaxID=2035198 RepID=UPI000C195138|nr:hypothetical protein [Flavobacterium sp. 9]PIF33012.1 hypothetical protein CLU81_3582 [Flavobacterium sp. 9]